MHTWVRCLRAVLIAAAVVPAVRASRCAAERPLTGLREVAESFLEPGPIGPVDVEAAVTGRYLHSGITLRDETGATFAGTADDSMSFTPGDRVRVRGTVYEGVFINGIAGATFELLGHGPAPVPRPVQAAQLATGAFFHDLVTAAGVVRAVRRLSENSTILTLNADGGPLEVRLAWILTADEEARIVDAEVQVTGFGSGEVNTVRHLIRPYLRVVDPGGLAITAAAAPDPFMAPILPLDRITVGLKHGHRVKVVGVASARGGVGGGVYLAADDHGLFVAPAEIDDAVWSIAPGDLVEAVGFATPGPAAITLGDAVLRVVGSGPAVTPTPLPDEVPRGVSSAAWKRWRRRLWLDSLPIETDIDVVARIDRDGTAEIVGTTPVRQVTIRCLAQSQPREAVPGSRIRVRGVCRVTATDRDLSSPAPIAYDVWTASAADVAIVRRASWWKRPEVARLLAVLFVGTLCAAVAAAAWVVFLRRQVRRQVGVIEGQLKTEAVLEERQRIAREFHDSLEQDLAAMALRLGAAAEAVADAEAHDVLSAQRLAVLRLQDESHQFVWDLRDAAHAERPLSESLARLVEDLRHLSPAPIALRIAGPLPSPPLAARQQMLRIVREAVANAVSHAHAAKIAVSAGSAAGRVTIEVQDDGEGFDVAAAERRAAHFGLRGMRERAWRVGAVLDIESSARSGTRVVLALDAGRPEGGSLQA